MTREDIKKHFPEATEEQISALLDINSRDIGKHKTAAERSERLGRFDKAHEEAGKGRKWLNDFTRDGIFTQFEKALADDTNKGKSDVQIYNSIINDDKGVKPGLFEAQVSGSGGYMGGMGGSPSGDNAWLQQKYKGNPFFEG